MDRIVWLIIVSLGIFILIYLYLRVYHKYIFRAIRLTLLRGRKTSSIDDYKYFPVRDIYSVHPSSFPKTDSNDILEIEDAYIGLLGKMDSVAFLVAKDGLLIFEKYWNGHQVGTLSNSFSMAKSVVVMLLGCAIKDGFIESLQTNVSDYFPVYSKGKGSRLTVGDLARMSTGMDWQEEYYLPFNVTTQAYYGDQLNKLILGRKIKEDPGKSFTYLSGNTQLLAMVLSEVLPCTLSEYLTKKIWSPLGMESDAKWMIDESVGMERAYCCINATARDFLRLGQLLLQKGQWDNKIILDEEYVDLMTRPAFLESPQYGYGLWLDLHYEYPFYMMRGHLGQYVIVIPSMDLVITRLGKKNAKREVEGKQIPEDVYSYIEGVMSAVS